MTSSDLSISIDGYNVAAKQYGNPEDPPLLALHGWLDNANSFDAIAPLLTGYHVIAMDFLGHGHSDRLAPEAIYHFTDATIHVQQVLKALGWQKATLLGHSMGGAVASLYAGLFPQQIEKLVILEGLGPLSEDHAPARDQLLDYMKKRLKLTERHKHYYATLEDAARARAQKGYLGLIESAILAERGTENTPKGWVWRHDPRLLLPSPIRLQEAQVVSFLKAITCPVCFIEGEQGFEYDAKKMQGRKQAIAQLQEHMTPGGHHMHMEHPETVAKIMLNFLNTA